MNYEPSYSSKGVFIEEVSSYQLLSNDNVVLIITLLCILLIGITIIRDGNRLRQTFDTILGDRWINQNLKDKFSFGNRNSLLLLCCYVLGFSLLALSANSYWNIFKIEPLTFVVVVSTSMFVLFWIKRMALYLTAWSIGFQNEINEYLFNHSIYTLASGLIIIPFVIILNFTKFGSIVILKSTFVFLLLFLLLRLMKITSLSIKNKIGSLFYIILYICTLEILPLVVLYKVLVSEIA